MSSTLVSEMSSPSGTLMERVVRHLQRGSTVEAIASHERISLVLAELMVDELSRRGMVAPAQSFCASGLGACSGGDSDQTRLHCSGCPLTALKIRTPA